MDMHPKTTWPHLKRAATLALSLIMLSGFGAMARAASVPTGFQEYEVLGQEQHVYNFFNQPVLFSGIPPFIYALSGAMLSVVSATASSDNQIIYYDQWEDGFEVDLLNPAQPTTLVFGDQNTANGRACDYLANVTCNGNPVNDDTVNTGDTLSLASNTNTGTGAAPNCGGPGNLSGCVPLNPRVSTDLRFDGGDRLLASGGPLSLVHIQEPTANLGGILGGAVEILPKQALTNATSYSVPVGQDTFTNLGGTNTPGQPFQFVNLDLVAFEDGTQVQVTSPVTGTVNFTLNQGQHWSSLGLIDGVAAPSLVINAGTKVSVNKPVGGLIFAAGSGTFATRSYALLPDLLHSNDYVITAPGDNPGNNGSALADLYVHNPDPVNTISVTTTDSVGSTTFNIGPNGTIPYSIATGRVVPQDSTVRLSSASNFWGLSAYDSQGTAFDWGHSWLATDFLTETYTIPHAPDNPGAPPGASPAYAAATQDNTCIRVDFDNNGTFDLVGDGTGGTLAQTCTNGYLVNALSALKIYDNNAADGTPNNDITGARVAANKPVSMAYGLDTDSSPTSGTGILDLGYAIYPVIQKFLNPVLTINKTASASTVPASGGTLTYRLEVDAFDFAPINALTVTDLLPATVGSLCGGCLGGYVPGSTIITYPDLSTLSGPAADPTLAVSAGRDQLTWTTPTLAPDSLNKNEKLVIEYQVAIPAGASTVLTNNARANGRLGASQFFTPEATTDVVRTDVQFSKTVSDDGTPQAGELLTYSFTITNNGLAAETNVVVSDPIPANTTFEPATVVNSANFTGAYVPGQNAVVWNAANLPAGASETVSFQVRVNALASAGTVITDTGNYESTQTQNFDSNTVTTTLVGPNLVIDKIAVGNPNPVHPGETVTFEVTVKNTGAGSASNLFITDPIQANGTYTANSMTWKLNAGAFNALTDANDGVEASGADGRLNAGTLEFRLASLAPGEDITLRFDVTVSGANGASLSNQATVSSDETAPADTPLVQILIDGNATVTGHLFADTDGNGSQGAGEPDLANIDVLVTDEDGNTQIVSTDTSGNYTVVVPADNVVSPGATTVDVDETDPNFPPGATLTTANDPQNVVAIANNTVATTPVGYQTAPVSISKSSDVTAPGAAPGQTITYTIAVTNNTGITQTGVTVSDALPAGTSYVANSTTASVPIAALTDTFRDEFTVIPPGPAGIANGNDGTQNFVAPWQEVGESSGFDNGDIRIITHASSNRLRLRDNQNGGEGAERDVDLTNYTSAILTFIFRRQGTNNSGSAWTLSTATGSCAAPGAFTPRATFTDASNDATFQQFRMDLAPVTGNIACIRIRGDNSVGNTETLYLDNFQIVAANAPLADFIDGVDAVSYAGDLGAQSWTNTWQESGDDGLVNNGDLQALSNQTDNRLRVQNSNRSLTRELNLSAYSSGFVSYFYRRNSLENSGEILFANISNNGGSTFSALRQFDGIANNGDAEYVYQRHDISTFLAANSQLQFASNGSVSNADRVYFDQIMVFATPPASELRSNAIAAPIPLANGVPPNLIVGGDAITLPAGTTLTITYQVTVNDPLAGGITDITNTASVTTNESGAVNDSVIDPVIRPRASVEPNGAASVPVSGAAQTVTFDHTVTNSGDNTDSFAMTAISQNGWKIELIDPATGVVLATDSNGDGTWDGGALPNTGTLTVGASRNYRLRVEIPAATPLATLETVNLTAASDTTPSISASAVDEITLVDGTTAGSGDVTVSPDNASFTTAGTQVAYTHTITNNSGAAHSFALQTTGTRAGWTATIYQDSNGDGIYTPGVDTAITNSMNLADGASQEVFLVLDVPGGAASGDVDTTNLVASFFDDGGTPLNPLDDTNLGGTATDTTTITAAGGGNSQLGFSLSGGGTQVVNAGDIPAYPGKLTNTGDSADVYEFSISASPFANGQPNDDNLVHASELWVDTTGNGVADTRIAADTDGDGIWDQIDANGDGSFDPPGTIGIYNADGDLTPDLSLPAGASLDYELRRPVDAAQGPYADPVTLTATSNASSSSDSVTATTSVQLATRAEIAGIQAYRSPRGVLVEWTTSSELGTVGFNLLRYDNNRDRWRRVNRRLLPGLLHSRNGGVYRLRDRGVRVGDLVSYKLEELEATGAHFEYGPFEVLVAAAPPTEPAAADTDQPLPGFERVARALSAIKQQRIQAKLDARQAALLERKTRRGPQLKISIFESGLYRLGVSELAGPMGLSETQIRNLIAGNRMQLMHLGKRVATLAAAGNNGLLFYAEAIDSLYTRNNVYLLKQGKGLRMSRSNARLPAPANSPGFLDTAHAEGNRYYLTHLFDDPDADYWMWDFRFEDMVFPSMLPDFRVRTPSPSGTGTATVTVRLHGGLEAQHKATISLNGKTLGDAEWQGLLPHTARFEIPAADLIDGNNTIEITGNSSGDPANPSVFYINDMDIRYRRQYRLDGGRLAATRERNGPRIISVDGLGSTSARVLDTSNPQRPRLLFNLTRDTGTNGQRLSFKVRASLRRFLVVEDSAIETPVAIVADSPSLLRDRQNRADWLIITASDMLDAARELADYRSAQGLRTMVVDIEDIYDEFSHGIRDANAIWSFLKYAHKRWKTAPRYVVLGGEGSFDYKDYLGNGDSIIPTLLAPTQDGLYPSDNLYADVKDNDFLPDLAIGRLPVINAAELRAVTAKIIAYEASSGNWTQRAILASDAQDQGGDFAAASDAVAAEIPGTITLEQLNLESTPLAAARFQLFAGLNDGRAFFNFFGHANDGSIGNINPGLMNSADLTAADSPLNNGANLPVITAFTCLVGQFGYPGGDALGELLVVTPDKGAAAVFSPSGLSRNRLAKRLGSGFYKATYQDGELLIGEAILKAQRQFLDLGTDAYLLDIYNLLGDPATIMK